MINTIYNWLLRSKSLWIIAILMVVGVSVHQFLIGRYNNFSIFRSSFDILRSGQDLYIHHPEYYWDLYKYSPTFALMMAPFYYLPIPIGLLFWNGINTLSLIWGIIRLDLTPQKRLIFFAIIFQTMLTSMQNSQSNGLMAGIILIALTYFEKEQQSKGLIAIISSAFVKIFSLGLGLIVIPFIRKKTIIPTVILSLLTLIILIALPLILIPFDELLWQYQNWLRMLKTDDAQSYGYSVMGVLNSWFGYSGKNAPVQLIGLILLVLPLVQFSKYNNPIFQRLFTASVAIWLLIFNHKSESPTFIVGLTGVALWWVTVRFTRLHLGLLILVLIFASISPTDLFPAYLRKTYINPFCLHAFALMVLWGYIQVQLWSKQFNNTLQT